MSALWIFGWILIVAGIGYLGVSIGSIAMKVAYRKRRKNFLRKYYKRGECFVEAERPHTWVVLGPYEQDMHDYCDRVLRDGVAQDLRSYIGP